MMATRVQDEVPAGLQRISRRFEHLAKCTPGSLAHSRKTVGCGGSANFFQAPLVAIRAGCARPDRRQSGI